jgi:hypothetical protein
LPGKLRPGELVDTVNFKAAKNDEMNERQLIETRLEALAVRVRGDGPVAVLWQAVPVRRRQYLNHGRGRPRACAGRRRAGRLRYR